MLNQPKIWTYATVTLATVAMLAYTWIGVERERRMMDDLRRLEYRALWIETQLMQRHHDYEGFLHHLGYTCRGEYVMDSLIRRKKP